MTATDGHAVVGGHRRQAFVVAGAVEQAETGMQMQVNEVPVFPFFATLSGYSHSIVPGGLEVTS